MGSKILSSDMLVSTFLFPSIQSYNHQQYDQAANVLYSFNNFFATFGDSIEDMPEPIDPIIVNIHERLNPGLYFKSYFEKYLPLVAKCLGKYQKLELDAVKEDSGRF